MISRFRSKIKAWLSQPELSQGVASWPGGVILSSLSITIIVLILRQLGLFQGAELSDYDRLIEMMANRGQDERLLVVGVTEEDIQKYGYPLSDQVIADLIQRLQQDQPRAIGLDILRDVPQGQGRGALIQALAPDNLIIVCRMNQDEQSRDIGTPPPQEIQNPDKIGFADFNGDNLGVIRRGILISYPLKWDNIKPSFTHICNDPTQELQSFGLRLALIYLAQEGIRPEINEFEEISLNDQDFIPLDPTGGGYVNIWEEDYQILLDYRAKLAADEVSLSAVLNNQVSADKIKNKIVLIGYTAASVGDFLFTPLGLMAGVQVHAQFISQILGITLEDQRLISYLPDGVEWLFIWGWSLVGSGIVWLTHKNRWLMFLSEGIAVVILVGVSYGAFITQTLWLPLIPSAWALILTAIAIYIGQKPIQKALKADGSVDWDQVRQEETKQKEAIEKKYREEFLETLTLESKSYQEQLKQWRKSHSSSLKEAQDLNPGEQMIIDDQVIQQNWVSWLENFKLEIESLTQKWKAKAQDSLYQGKRESVETLLQKSRLLRASE
jgi:adenylate cyclase